MHGGRGGPPSPYCERGSSDFGWQLEHIRVWRFTRLLLCTAGAFISAIAGLRERIRRGPLPSGLPCKVFSGLRILSPGPRGFSRRTSMERSDQRRMMKMRGGAIKEEDVGLNFHSFSLDREWPPGCVQPAA